MGNTSGRAITGRTVRVCKTPPGCCGVLRHGHIAKVKEVIEHHDLAHHGRILLLEDDVLVWESDIKLEE